MQSLLVILAMAVRSPVIVKEECLVTLWQVTVESLAVMMATSAAPSPNTRNHGEDPDVKLVSISGRLHVNIKPMG